MNQAIMRIQYGKGEVIDEQVYDEFLSTFLGPKLKVKLDASGEEKCFQLKDLVLPLPL